MYDVIVIGGGPAGLAAAIYLARQKMKFMMLTGDIGGQTIWSSDIENYLGFHLIDGVKLVGEFRKHLDDYRDAFELHEGEQVTKVEAIGDGSVSQRAAGFRVTTGKGTYETKTVLIATGEKHRELNVTGEKELYGRGVTYCATCDAPLFGGKDVVVVGGGNSAMDAALFLEKYASHVTLMTVNKELSGDAVMKGKCESSPKISVITNAKTVRILGTEQGKVSGIEYQLADGSAQTKATEGVFIEIGLVPVSGFIDIVQKDRWGQIVVDKYNATSVPGIWAAGDVTDVTEKQIAVAAGEGSKAALGIIKWLQSQPR
ncbi:MAG TPA: FAD-dependent oxidoreductase [Candidatus Methylomirabilis sp.]|nr:FAD-dependent oxidoreductase [Candidatus Methylomirabilis sp.]